MFRRHIRTALTFVALVGLTAAIAAFAYWRRTGQSAAAPASNSAAKDAEHEQVSLQLTPQARKNLGLSSQALKPTTWWRTIEVPGIVTDRPGISDRGVTAQVTGVVTKIHAYPGDTVEPNAPLFSLRLVSPSLHASQLELFKATKEMEIARAELRRLEGLAQSGTVPRSRIIEIENQIARTDVNVQAYRQDLVARGLPTEQIEAAAQGRFVTEVSVNAPSDRSRAAVAGNVDGQPPFSFEVQQLKVELGQQVEAGEVLCYLADHRSLWIEGRGFKEDMPHVQRAAQERLPVEIEFEAPAAKNWPPMSRELHIDHVANMIDPHSRTFAFYLPLENQWHAYTQDGKTRLVWRFRPGGRVRLRVAIERLDGVFVLPQDAVVREGPEAYVFRQNGGRFDRLSVHVVAEDRTQVVIANDGSVWSGTYVATNGAAALNRVWKTKSAGSTPSNVHVHADGSVHGAH